MNKTEYEIELRNNALIFAAIVLLSITGLMVSKYWCEPVRAPTQQEIQESNQGPPVGATERSGKWQTVKRNWLKQHPVCEACGVDFQLNVHHIKPFHTHPHLELDTNNLLTLCRTHHFTIGHDPDGPWKPAKPNWETANPNVIADCKKWRSKL